MWVFSQTIGLLCVLCLFGGRECNNLCEGTVRGTGHCRGDDFQESVDWKGEVGVTLQGVNRVVEARVWSGCLCQGPEPKLHRRETPRVTGQAVTQPLTGLGETPKCQKRALVKWHYFLSSCVVHSPSSPKRKSTYRFLWRVTGSYWWFCFMMCYKLLLVKADWSSPLASGTERGSGDFCRSCGSLF